jgi:hypothetical protein
MLVKASVSQPGVSHHSGNRRAIQAFGADPLGSVFHDLLMGLEFMFRRITHNDFIGCSESS